VELLSWRGFLVMCNIASLGFIVCISAVNNVQFSPDGH